MTRNANEHAEDRVNSGLLGLWYVVAKSSDIRADRPHGVKALGRRLVLWRETSGTLRCLEDFCPHRGAPLSRGEVIGDNIACRYHGVTLDGGGTILQVPAMPECPLEGRRVATSYPVTEANDGVFVYFPSAEYPAPRPLNLPFEFTSDSHTSFLCTAPWACNYRYVLDNVSDPMHGPYLHANSFTLAYGAKQDLVKLDETGTGFILTRHAQQGTNLDWTEILTEDTALHGRVEVPLPPAGGPGKPMRVITFVTPVDDDNCQLFFWRTREGSRLELQTWRFMFRALLEQRHWDVLEQDREMLTAMPSDARGREMLYQHDMGLTRLRRAMARQAQAQLEREIGAAQSSVI